MNIALKVVCWGFVGLGLSFIASVIIGSIIEAGNRRPPPPAQPTVERIKPTLTVVWRDTDVMFQAFTGTVELVGAYYMKVTDDTGYAVMVDRRDVVEVH
jgi:hypothetical protein